MTTMEVSTSPPMATLDGVTFQDVLDARVLGGGR
jgi:hypothetical protein